MGNNINIESKWEEKSQIEPSLKLENSLMSDLKIITHETEKKFEEKEWIVIGEKKKWIRTCPKCEGLVFCSSKKNRNKSAKSLIICRKCKDFGQMKGEFKKCLHCEKEFYASLAQSRMNWAKFCSSRCAMFYRSVCQENKHFDSSLPRYNKIACKFIDEYAKSNGFNFQHAMNGGEVNLLWYFVDGYDKEKNVIFEYNEKHHYNKFGLRPNDKIRLTKLISEYRCEVIIYNEKLKTFERYGPNKPIC